MIAYAVCAFAAVLVLGAFARRAPVGIDANVARLALGKATPLAWTFTKLGYARDIVLAYAIASLFFHYVEPAAVPALGFLAIAQVVSQLISTGLKDVFKRRRPEHWLKRHETSAGYPSGHATTAVVTYLGIALVAFAPFHPLPSLALRNAFGALAIVCGVGIGWSRLALGAHYLSDVLGGVLLGSATLAVLVALL